MSTKEEANGKPGHLGNADYGILVLSILIPFVIAIWTSFRNKKSTQDFFTASHSMGPVPVALSLLSSYITGFMILAYSSDIYGFGLQYTITVFGVLISIPLFAYMILKVFYDLEVTTIYEYLELRYHSVVLRACLTLTGILAKFFSMGMSLFGSCLVLAAVTPVDVEIYILILGLLCAFYATIGGMRGVIWTDSFMMLVMFVGLFVVIVLGSLQLGPSNIWTIAREGGRTKIFNFNPSLYQRQNFYLAIMGGMLGFGKLFGVNQIVLQRALSLKSFKEYKRVIAGAMFGYIVMSALMFGSGLTAYAMYAGCDPFTAGKIRKIDQIIPFLISDKMGDIPGISGLFLSAMVCAGVSSVSSAMNALSNLVFSDLLLNINFFKQLPERSALLLCRAMTFLTALPAIGIAIIVSKARGILVFISIIFGMLSGPKAGVFFLALLFPMSKLSAAIAGFLSSLVVLGWLAVGRLLNKHQDPYLPLSTDLCNVADRNATFILEYLRSISTANQSLIDSGTIEPSSPSSLYNVSYLCFFLVGPVVCIVVGVSCSYLTGKQNVEDVPRELISPFVRRIFYKGRKDQEDQQTEMTVKL